MAKSKSRKKIAPRKAAEKKQPKTLAADVPQIARLEPVNVVVKDERKGPRLLSILFCDFINLAKEDKPNLIGVFDSINVDRATKITPHFFVFIRVAEVDDTFVTTVFNGDDLPVLQFRSVILQELSRDLPRQSQTIIRLQIKQIEKEGVFWFDVSYKGNSLGGAGLPIHYKPEGEQGSGTTTYI